MVIWQCNQKYIRSISKIWTSYIENSNMKSYFSWWNIHKSIFMSLQIIFCCIQMNMSFIIAWVSSKWIVEDSLDKGETLLCSFDSIDFRYSFLIYIYFQLMYDMLKLFLNLIFSWISIWLNKKCILTWLIFTLYYIFSSERITDLLKCTSPFFEYKLISISKWCVRILIKKSNFFE